MKDGFVIRDLKVIFLLSFSILSLLLILYVANFEKKS